MVTRSGSLLLRSAQLFVLLGLEAGLTYGLVDVAARLLRRPHAWLSELSLTLLLVTGATVCIVEVAVGLRGVVRHGTAVWQLRRWLAQHQLPAAERLRAVGGDVLGGRPVMLVDSAGSFAMTCGYFRPQIVVSAGLLARVTDAELAAVLLHERHHAEHHDALARVIFNLVRVVLWLRLGGDRMSHHHMLCQELAADRAALRGSHEETVARALLKVADPPRFASAAAGMQTTDLLEARVRQLEAGREAVLPGRHPHRHPGCLLMIGGALSVKVLLVFCICHFFGF